MFGKSPYHNLPSSRGRRPGFRWWVLILTLVLGVPLLLLQMAPPVGRTGALPTPVPAAPDGHPDTETSGNRPFLPEYQPDGIPALDEETTRPGAPAGVADLSGWSALDVVAKLVLVIGLAYLAIAGLRWLQKGRRRPADGSGVAIRLLETTGLAPGRWLHLVAVGEKTLLIGATEYQVSLLADLQSATVPAEEEATDFEEALRLRSTAPLQSSAVGGVDWQLALDRLRTGARRMRETLRGPGDESTA